MSKPATPAKPAGLTLGDVDKGKTAAKPAPKPPSEEVSQQTAPEPESAPEPSAPKDSPAALSDAELIAEMKRRGLAKDHKPARPTKGGIAVPMEIRDDLAWKSSRFGNHLIQIAAAPQGGYFAKPESFVGDTVHVENLDALEEFESWPNALARK